MFAYVAWHVLTRMDHIFCARHIYTWMIYIYILYTIYV
jgi:hypothetical protein